MSTRRYPAGGVGVVVKIGKAFDAVTTEHAGAGAVTVSANRRRPRAAAVLSAVGCDWKEDERT